MGSFPKWDFYVKNGRLVLEEVAGWVGLGWNEIREEDWNADWADLAD